MAVYLRKEDDDNATEHNQNINMVSNTMLNEMKDMDDDLSLDTGIGDDSSNNKNSWTQSYVVHQTRQNVLMQNISHRGV